MECLFPDLSMIVLKTQVLRGQMSTKVEFINQSITSDLYYLQGITVIACSIIKCSYKQWRSQTQAY